MVRLWRSPIDIAHWTTIGDPDWPTHGAPDRVTPPPWLDPERCDHGGRALRRHGLLTSAVLRSYSLPLSYLSPTGIRPLLFTGRLVDDVAPRLYRTAVYVNETQQRGAMHADGPSWRTAATVRTVHQHIRGQLRAQGWSHPEAPLPQTDLAATALLFGPLVVDGLRRLGARIGADEADDVAHLARAMAHGQGVVPELQADSHEASMTLFAALTAHDAPADEGGRQLMEALLDIPHRLARNPVDRAIAPVLRTVYRSLSVHLLGPEQAPSLGLEGRGRIGRGLSWVGAGPWYHAATAPWHDRGIRWVMARGRERMLAGTHAPGSVSGPAARSSAPRPRRAVPA